MENKNKPLVSVLMTAYNAGDYVGYSIESILEQTYANFEFIIIEDCSKDNTWEVIKKYSKEDKRITAVRNETNLNAGGASNKGLEMCKGKYIVRMDADDWSFPDRIEKQVKFMEENPNTVCLGGSMVVCDENLNEIGTREYPLKHEDILKQILRFDPIPHPASIWRKEAVDKTTKYPTKIGMSEDYALTLEITQHGELANMKDELVKYRVHKKSASNAKMRYQQAVTVYLSYKAEFEYKFKPTFGDQVWRLIQILTMYTVPVSVKRFLFNILVARKKVK